MLIYFCRLIVFSHKITKENTFKTEPEQNVFLLDLRRISFLSSSLLPVVK